MSVISERSAPIGVEEHVRDLRSLPTPCAVLDRGRLRANAERMLTRAEALGVSLRPHVKTIKCVEAAEIATGGSRSGITVSTLREAEAFFEAGFNDILYAVSITPSKFSRVTALWTAGCDIKLVLDDFRIACEIGLLAERANVTVDVLIEIDSDGHRAGLQPKSDLIRPLARQLHEQQGTRFAGLMTHAGESYGCLTTDAVADLAEQERSAVTDVATFLAASGFPCPIVSVGSTPTAMYAEHLDEVSELRAGVYLLGDLFQTNRECCELDQIAMSVLCEVIGHQPSRNWLITDAGGLALSKDTGTTTQAAAKRGVNYQFGAVCTMSTCELISGWRVFSANQEHGLITSVTNEPIDFSKYPIGSRLRILPVHACMTAACHDGYYVVDGGEEVVEFWPRVNGW